MSERLRAGYELVKEAGAEFGRDKAMRLGAAIAFYAALSLSPLVVLVVAIAGMVFGEQAASGQLKGQIEGLVGADGAAAVETMLASHQQSSGVIATVIGVITLIVGSTGVFAELKGAIDTAWGVEPQTEGLGLWQMVKDRLLSFTLVGGLAFLLLVSLVVSAVLSGLNGVLNRWFPGSEGAIQAGNMVLSFALTAVMFALIFKVLPHARPAWSDVWVGAGITAVLFALGKYLIGLYLGQAAVGSAYGAAGSFVVLLVWIYYSTLILLFGAELTQVYAARHGSGVRGSKPARDAAAGGEPDRAGSPVPRPA